MSGQSPDLSEMPDVRLVRELFPFCFTLDRDMRLAIVGARWASFEPAVAPGVRFEEVFEIERPSGVGTDALPQGRRIAHAHPINGQNPIARLHPCLLGRTAVDHPLNQGLAVGTGQAHTLEEPFIHLAPESRQVQGQDRKSVV